MNKIIDKNHGYTYDIDRPSDSHGFPESNVFKIMVINQLLIWLEYPSLNVLWKKSSMALNWTNYLNPAGKEPNWMAGGSEGGRKRKGEGGLGFQVKGLTRCPIPEVGRLNLAENRWRGRGAGGLGSPLLLL